MEIEPSVSAIVPSSGSVSRCALCSAGSLGSVPLLRRSYGALRRPAPPLRSLALALAVARHLPAQKTGPPKFLDDPRHACPGSSTPAKPPEQASGTVSLRFAPSAWPSEPSASSAFATSTFRGPIPQPTCSLFTLRDPGCPRSPRKTRFRLAALPWPGGSPTRWVAASSFSFCLGLHGFLLIETFLAHRRTAQEARLCRICRSANVSRSQAPVSRKSSPSLRKRLPTLRSSRPCARSASTSPIRTSRRS